MQSEVWFYHPHIIHEEMERLGRMKPLAQDHNANKNMSESETR